MKKLLLVLLFSSVAFAQGVRFGDGQPVTSTLTVPGSGTVLSPVSNPIVNFCNYPANAVPCTNKATTFTDSTLTTPCSTATQITAAGSTSCVATGDSTGNWGVWAQPGQYAYTFTIGSRSFGPYPATLATSNAGGLTSATVATLPGSPTVNQAVIVTDSQTLNSCSVGGGTFRTICQWSGSAWITVSSSGGGTWGTITGTLANQTDLSTQLTTLSSATSNTPPRFVTSGLMADYDFTEGSGTTITDRSGNGNTGTFGAGGFAPTWVSSSTGGLAFNGQYVSLPAALNASVTVELYLSWQGSSQTLQYTAPISGTAVPGPTSNTLILQRFNNTYNTLCYMPSNLFNNATGSTTASTCFNGTGMLTWTMNVGATPDSYYIGAYKATSVSSAGGSRGVQTAGNYQLGGAGSNQGVALTHYTNMTVYRARFFNRALSDAEVAQDSVAMQIAMSNRGITTSLGSNTGADTALFDGDSLTSGLTQPQPPTAFLTLSGFTILNFGTGGRTLSDELVYAPYGTDPQLPLAGRSVVTVWLGTNDMRISGKTAAQTFANLVTYCRARHAAGWKVIVATMISSTTGGADAQKNSYNALIRQNWRSFADGLADLASSTKIGADGSSANATYFSDGTHITTLSQQNIVAPIMQTAVLSLYGNYDISTANVYTTSSTQADADNYAVLGAITGAATYTLESCQRWMGKTITLKNTNASGFAWTIAAGTGLGGETEQVEGASTLASANGSTTVLQPVLVSASAAGCNWRKIN